MFIPKLRAGSLCPDVMVMSDKCVVDSGSWATLWTLLSGERIMMKIQTITKHYHNTNIQKPTTVLFILIREHFFQD